MTYAALILLGTRPALGRYLADSEVVLEYRSSESDIEYESRREYREGFLLFHDDLWQTINSRNEIQHYQDGLFKWGIPTFSERPVREAVLNAVVHRDYRQSGSVFVRQYQRLLRVTSPGGFPAGITEQNILSQQAWRNRRLAETLARCGLVERSGQGVDLMFESCLQEGKPRPSFAGTDAHHVSVTLHGTADHSFVRFLEGMGQEMQRSFSIEDMLVLDLVHHDESVPEDLAPNLRRLVDTGIVERRGRGDRAKHHLARRYYREVGRPGNYTRKVGLDREAQKQLLLKHIRDNANEGSRLRDLIDVLPYLGRSDVQQLVRDLQKEGAVHCRGRTRAGRWFPGPAEGEAP